MGIREITLVEVLKASEKHVTGPQAIHCFFCLFFGIQIAKKAGKHSFNLSLILKLTVTRYFGG